VSDILIPAIDNVRDALRGAGALGEPAELHGQLCGLVCLLGPQAGAAWVADVLSDGAGDEQASRRAAGSLLPLAESTCNALGTGDLSLVLLLPDDDEPLELRADALGHWCQGFLHGLGIAGAGAASSRAAGNHEIVREVVADFSRISQAGFVGDDTEEEAESAYAELVEYVRAAVQLLFEELAPVREAGKPSPGYGLSS